MSRRRFLALTGGTVAGGSLGAAAAWRALVQGHVEDAHRPENATDPAASAGSPGGSARAKPTDRVLVVVQLGGGNDGLNTLVPVGDGAYHDARPTLAVGEDRVVALSGLGGHGLHPGLGPIASLWEAGRLAAVDAIGFPQQTRSHFAALDTWWSAVPGQGPRTGWLGRWLDASATDRLPNPLRAIALGAGSPALAAEHSLSTVVFDPRSFSLATPPGAGAAAITAAFRSAAGPQTPEPTGGDLLAGAQRAMRSTVDAIDVLRQAAATDPGRGAGNGAGTGARPAGSGVNTSARGNPGVVELLQSAAGIIGLRLGTQVIIVSAGDYDTHANQAPRHDALLTELGAGLRAFHDSVEASGDGPRTLVLTTSEFGRRVAENGSGTDHGNASVQFLSGEGLARAQVVGRSDLIDLDRGDVRPGIDARSLYAVGLDWLSGGDDAVTDAVLHGSFDRYGLLR